MQQLSMSAGLGMGFSISPMLIQSQRIIKMSNEELADHIKKALSENPFLQEKKQTVSGRSMPGYFYPVTTFSSGKANKTTVIEKCVASQESLYEYLLKQLSFNYSAHSREYSTGDLLLSGLDKNGYMPESVIAYSRQLYGSDLTSRVTKKLQSFDPPGICAGNVIESLLIQLNGAEKHDLAKTIIKNHLHRLKWRNFKKIANLEHVSVSKVIDSVSIIAGLEPKPARNFRSSMENKFITPDVTVRRKPSGMHSESSGGTDDFEIIIDNETVPTVVIDRYYQTIHEAAPSPSLTEYFNKMEKQALNLISSLKYRKDNLLKTTFRLLKYQRDFFLNGPKYIKPLTLIEFSRRENIGESSLSRLLNSKYIQTEWGVMPLRYFFSLKVNEKSGGVSSTYVKELVRDFVEKDRGISDKDIAAELKKHEIFIARRTVAKYRKKLEILSLYER